jgi:hypothetical protein
MCFKYNLNGKVGPLKRPNKDQPPSAMYSIKEKIFEISKAEMFDTQIISVIGPAICKAVIRKRGG